MEELLPGRLPFFSFGGNNPGEQGGTDPGSWSLVIPFISGNDAYEAVVRFVRGAAPRFAQGKISADETTPRPEDFDLHFLRGMMGGVVPDPPAAAENLSAVAVDLTFRRSSPGPDGAPV